jgi:hypothetical protein
MKIRRLAIPMLVMTLTAVGAQAASANSAQPLHSNGQCYGNLYVGGTGTFSGWCDGNGPQTYEPIVKCANGHSYAGVQRWFGDRRGSTAQCPSGVKATSGSFAYPLGT